jgi:DNA polymerase V
LLYLKQAIASYTQRAAVKLRKQGSLASFVCVFIQTSRFSKEKQCSLSLGGCLQDYTDYTPDLIAKAEKLLEKIYKPDYKYKKAGVYLAGFINSNFRQAHLLKEGFASHKKRKIMNTVDLINEKFGKDTLFYGASGFNFDWETKPRNKSGRYTTRWEELMVVKAK